MKGAGLIDGFVHWNPLFEGGFRCFCAKAQQLVSHVPVRCPWNCEPHEFQSRPQRPHLPVKRWTKNATHSGQDCPRFITLMMPSVKLAPICDIRNAARDIGPLSLAGGVVREEAGLELAVSLGSCRCSVTRARKNMNVHLMFGSV